MSLFKKIIRGAGKLIGKAASFVPGPIGTVAKVATGIGAAAGAARAASKVGGGLQHLPAVRALPGIGTISSTARRVAGGAARVGGTVATGAVLYDQFGNPMRRRSKRINPLNHKALNRALRRVCKAKTLADRLNAIEIKSKSKRKVYAC